MQLKDAKLFRQQAYVDGAWVDADNGQTIKVNNPATGEIIGSVPKMGAAETRRAIEAADKALPAWRALTAKERANKLRRWFDLMIENQDDLARLMTIEQGKPLAEAKGEIAYAASFLEWFGEEAKRIYGDTIPGHQPAYRSRRRRGDSRSTPVAGASRCPGAWRIPRGCARSRPGSPSG